MLLRVLHGQGKGHHTGGLVWAAHHGRRTAGGVESCQLTLLVLGHAAVRGLDLQRHGASVHAYEQVWNAATQVARAMHLG